MRHAATRIPMVVPMAPALPHIAAGFVAMAALAATYGARPIVVAAVLSFVMLWPFVRLLSRLENHAIAMRR